MILSILVGRGYSEWTYDKTPKPDRTVKIVIISANQTDPDVLLHSAASQLANILSRSYRKTMFFIYIYEPKARFSIYICMTLNFDSVI